MKKIHFVGIGGIGMSALADIALANGASVSGSDLRPNNLTENLHEKGVLIFSGHDRANLPEGTTLVVKSTCIRDDNPEIMQANEMGLPVILRGKFLEEVMKAYSTSVGITGTHGKTTTSSLMGHIAECCEKDPTLILGGEAENIKNNAKAGSSDLLIAEVDESDGLFRRISAVNGIVTNVEREHMEHYASFEDLKDAYKEFINNLSSEGVLVFNGEDPILEKLVVGKDIRKISFGINGEHDVTCKKYIHQGKIEFDLYAFGEMVGRVTSSLMGRYNIMNILAAVAMSMGLGFNSGDIVSAIGSFRGVKRRFERIGEIDGIKVIEDYAHHPTELKAVIKASKNFSEGRVIAIFQPHRYSRTYDMKDEFTECFYDADILVLTDIYSADEDIIEAAKVEDILNGIDRERFEKIAFMGKDKVPDFIVSCAQENDIVLVLGAGDIREVSGDIVKCLQTR